MGIQIRNGQRRRRVGLSRLRRVGERTLSVLGRPSDEVSVLLVGDRAIRRLNRAYLNHDHPTDVLAFPQPKSFPLPGPHLLGDVVISVDTAARQAPVLTPAERFFVVKRDLRPRLLRRRLELAAEFAPKGNSLNFPQDFPYNRPCTAQGQGSRTYR